MNKKLFSPAEAIGELLTEQMVKDPNFYFFSPDETTSNRFDEIFKVEKRAWSLKTMPWDLPESSSGRIVEMLSENVLFSVMTGHLANGEQAMMGSYEAFFPIITSQLLQQIKFIKQSKLVYWREPMPAVNLLSTSTCWRQDHNGFTHQSPALISQLLAHPANLVNCFFPVDDQSAKSVFNYMINSRDVINLTTFNKNEMPRYLSAEEADDQLRNHGVKVFDFCSDDDPDFIFVGVGDIVSEEAIQAIKILKQDLPDLKIRFINLVALSYRSIGTFDNQLKKDEFNQLFTPDKPIIANFHGWPETFETILENYTSRGRLRVHGFSEEGSTTTPFEMLRKNASSRYDLAIDVAGVLQRADLVSKYRAILEQNHIHAINFGTDLVK